MDGRSDPGPGSESASRAKGDAPGPPSAPECAPAGTSNYCWFADPSRALCLKLAGDPGRRQDPHGSGLRPAARRPPTTLATGPSGPSTPRTPRGPRPLGRARPEGHDCRPSTAAPSASWNGSTKPQPRENPDEARGSRSPTTRRRSGSAKTRLLNGDIPPGGKCDIETLAGEAASTAPPSTAAGPAPACAREFELRLRGLRDAGERPDPRDAQAARLKDEIARLKERLARSDATIGELAAFRAGPSPGSPPSVRRSPGCGRMSGWPPASAGCQSLPPRSSTCHDQPSSHREPGLRRRCPRRCSRALLPRSSLRAGHRLRMAASRRRSSFVGTLTSITNAVAGLAHIDWQAASAAAMPGSFPAAAGRTESCGQPQASPSASPSTSTTPSADSTSPASPSSSALWVTRTAASRRQFRPPDDMTSHHTRGVIAAAGSPTARKLPHSIGQANRYTDPLHTASADRSHSAATRWLRNGVPIEVVSALLGHSSVAVTSSVYGHLTAEDARAALEKAGWFTGKEVSW